MSSSRSARPAARGRGPGLAAALCVVAVVGFGVSASGEAQAAGEGELTATMQCERAAEPGRVRCTVAASLAAGRALAWGDVEIVALPEFASALKGRIGPQDALARDATSTTWALGLVARKAGQGEVKARVRVVACEPGRPGAPPSEPRARCAPIVVEVRAAITVG